MLIAERDRVSGRPAIQAFGEIVGKTTIEFVEPSPDWKTWTGVVEPLGVIRFWELWSASS